MPVLIRGENFCETTTTVNVSAHGCLVLLNAKAPDNDQVFLVNTRTAEEIPANVVFRGNPKDGKIPVGLAFAEASPVFWRINFPPDDWFNSAERRRPGATLTGETTPNPSSRPK